MENHILKIINGEILPQMRNMPDGSFDLIIADPPYCSEKEDFSAYLSSSALWLKEAKRLLTDNGTLYLFMNLKHISYFFSLLEKDLEMHYNSWITWHYTKGSGKTKGFSQRHDDILMFTKSQNDFIFNLDDIRVPQKYYRTINNMRGANPGNVWEFSHSPSKSPQITPTQKPEAIIERMVLASSLKNGKVLELWGGGTVLRVCQQNDRNCIGIEPNFEYSQLISLRLEQDFFGFDSIDERMFRVPNDLNDYKIREEYIKNHIEWFLKNHQDAIPKFNEDVLSKYKNKTEEDNQLSLF